MQVMIQESYTSLHREQTNEGFWNSLNWLCLYFMHMAKRWNARYLHDACCMSNLNLELFGFHCSKQLSNSPCYKSGFGLYLSDSDESVDSTVEKREEQADEWEEEAGLREQEANSVQMENNEWEENEEEAMEEERYITVLHNRLRREEFEKVKGIE